MSRDIRSFFLPKKTAEPKAEVVEDVIPESPDVQVINKKKSRKKRVLCDDSDEEIFSTKKIKTSKVPPKAIKKSPAKPVPLKEVKLVDLFGNDPIKRTEPLVKKVKSKKNTETGIHSDDEFDKSLLELDHIDEISQLEEQEAGKLNTVCDNTKITNDKIKEQKSPIKSEINTEADSDKFKIKKDIKHESKSRPKKSKMDNENKRKFSEFIDGDIKEEEASTSINIKEEASPKESESKAEKVKNQMNGSHVNFEDSINDSLCGSGKKKKMNKSLNESVLTDEERHERKMHSAALYKNYLNRSGPKHLGTKEMPEGAPDCLKDCAFLLTGVLDSFEREHVTEVIVNYGGCIKNSISKKVTHVLAGDDAGPSKMAKAQELGIKILNEDQFLDMIRNPTNNNIKDQKPVIKKEKSPTGKAIKDKSSPKKAMNGTNKSEDSNKKKHDEKKVKERSSKETKSKSPYENKTKVKIEKPGSNIDSTEPIPKASSSKACDNVTSTSPSIMWVDKYKPQNLKQIIGQHGDASNVKKLSDWLTKWYVNRKAKLPKPSPWAKNDNGGYYKAALLSGPPGVGKTTTVSLVCKELGFDVVEFNASDTRSKSLIKDQISELLSSTSLSGYAEGNTGKRAVTKKHVLVMDEVDGMAGNEDRGGLQELINLIKSTSVPIVCMCNDRNSQKMRSLVNYCYDLRFTKPRVDQIKSAMMSICFKEGVKVPPDVVAQLIVAANQDVRQTLHLLSVWAADPERADPDRLRKAAGAIRKDVKLGPWEAVRKVFSEEDHKTMTIHDKSDLFFYDYNLAPLFVQENYLQVMPNCPKNEILDRVSKAADSISIGDMVEARIRGSQAWALLPTMAMYSSVIPGHAVRGRVAGQLQFPGWLGKHSRASKMRRLAQELHAHTRLSTSGSKSSIFLDYSKHLRDAILTPLLQDRNDGIDQAMAVLEAYHLLREDLDSLVELSLWPGQRDPMVLVDSKVKAAMTRAYNKNAAALPYAPGQIKKGRARDVDADEYTDDAGEIDDPDDSDPENDALIKKKKSKETVKPSTSKDKAGPSKQKKEKKKK